MSARLSLAIPSKGRLREPSWQLLEASGVAPLAPGDRVLQTHCRNAAIDLLFVRADDIPEYVQDGVVDCGITGRDLVAESGCTVNDLAELDFGFCDLEVAVSLEDSATTLRDLDGRRVATSHPRLAQAAFDRLGIAAALVTVGGSVEIAPRLGLADAIVDLVSTGSTMRTNGLRSLGSVFSSQAVVVATEGRDVSGDLRTLIRMFQAVIEARTNRYLLFNVARTQLEDVVAVLPSAKSPTIVPLADPATVAVQSVVPASSIWSLLPDIEMRGATDILTLPIERMLR
jgi:ATP phosphoribosyltransferase